MEKSVSVQTSNFKESYMVSQHQEKEQILGLRGLCFSSN